MVDVIALQIAPTLDGSAEVRQFLEELRKGEALEKVDRDEAVLQYRDLFLDLPKRLNELLTLQIQMSEIEIRARD